MSDAQVGFLQDPRRDAAFKGKRYQQILDIYQNGLAGANKTPGMQSLWTALRVFDFAAIAPMNQPIEREPSGRFAFMRALGACLGALVPEGEHIVLDDREAVEPGDLCVFLYRAGLAPICKLYLGRWNDGEHPPFGERQAKFVHVFYQAVPRCLILLHCDDLTGAVRVTGKRDSAGAITQIARWAIDPRQDRDVACFCQYIAPGSITPLRVAEWDAVAMETKKEFFGWLELNMSQGDRALMMRRARAHIAKR